MGEKQPSYRKKDQQNTWNIGGEVLFYYYIL